MSGKIHQHILYGDTNSSLFSDTAEGLKDTGALEAVSETGYPYQEAWKHLALRKYWLSARSKGASATKTFSGLQGNRGRHSLHLDEYQVLGINKRDVSFPKTTPVQIKDKERSRGVVAHDSTVPTTACLRYLAFPSPT